MKKKFKVVKIIDDKSLVINGGSFEGVKLGDLVTIVGKSEPVIDPDTKSNLGQIDIIKAKLNVTDLYDRMCVCEAPYVSELASSITNANRIFSYKPKILEVDPFEISGIGDKVIRIGDEALVEHAEKPEKK